MSGVTQSHMARYFWPKVLVTDTCWLWTGGRGRKYGVWTPPKESGTRGRVAHRFAYESLVGPIPTGLELDHLCQNPPCVNPTHLEPVTREENMRRVRGRATHCPNGHDLSVDNNKYVRASGYYSCRACGRELARRKQGYYERRSA